MYRVNLTTMTSLLVKMLMVMVMLMMVAGELSQRMQIPGNVWVDVWQSARPVPARRQRRLFDDTKEAEKVTPPCTAQIHCYYNLAPPPPPHYSRFMSLFRDHPCEPVPEENFCTLWCKGRFTEADTLTIRLGATPSGLTLSLIHISEPTRPY